MGILADDFDRVIRTSIDTVAGDRCSWTEFAAQTAPGCGRGVTTRGYLENRIRVCLAGRVAEHIMLGSTNTTTAAKADLVLVAHAAHHMVAELGFSQTLGAVAWTRIPVAADAAIAAEITFLVDKLYQDTYEVLESNQFHLHRLSEALLERGTLDAEGILWCVAGICCDIR